MRLDKARLDQIKLNQNRLDQTRLLQTRFNQTGLDLIRLYSIRIDQTRLEQTRIHYITQDYIRSNQSGLVQIDSDSDHSLTLQAKSFPYQSACSDGTFPGVMPFFVGLAVSNGASLIYHPPPLRETMCHAWRNNS